MPIRIRALRPPGFYRCGVFHSSDWVTHPDDRFDEEELDRFRAEPMLQVETVESDLDAEEKELTVEDLKNELEARGVQFPPKAKKAELFELYKEAVQII